MKKYIILGYSTLNELENSVNNFIEKYGYVPLGNIIIHGKTFIQCMILPDSKEKKKCIHLPHPLSLLKSM